MLKDLSLATTPRLFFFVLSGLAIAISLLCASYVLVKIRPEETYYAYHPKTESYEKMFPLNQPNVSTRSLLSWATVAATATYTLDFLHADRHLEALKVYFTQDGYKKFSDSLEKSSRLNDMKAQKLMLSAVPFGPAVIVKEGILEGVYSWEIQIPMILTYQGASLNSTKETMYVSLLITRVPTTDAPKGIGISQIVEEKGSQARAT